MDKRFWAVIGVIIIVFLGVYYTTSKKNSTPSQGAIANLSQHTEGANKTGVSVVEYGDYECPVCGTFYPVVKQVVAKYNDDIKFQFRNFPLTSIHQNAFAGARAAEAAAMQNKFWEMHDMLYENQQAWATSPQPLSLFTQYAQQLGLDTAKFNQDYASEKVNTIINADLSEANQLKLTGTPTFFIDGENISLPELRDAHGIPKIEKFSAIIDKAIKAKKPKNSSSAPTTNSNNTAGTPSDTSSKQ